MERYLIENIITIDRYLEILAWSREDADKANELWVGNDTAPNWQDRNPIALWNVIQNIKNCHKLHLEGDKRAALHALSLSLDRKLPIPEWIRNAIVSAYNSINQYEQKNWNDVFGNPYPKNTVIKAKKKMRDLCWPVHDRISEITNENSKIPVDEYLFEQVGKEFGIGKTLASEYHYHIEKHLTAMMPQRKTRSALKKSRSKKTPA